MKVILIGSGLSSVTEAIWIAAGCCLACGLVEIGLDILRRLFGLEKREG